MNLDHHLLVRIGQILQKVEMNTLLLDSDGTVLLPEDDERKFNLPELFLRAPEEPFVYGGFTLIGRTEEHPLFLCLQGDSKEVAACARLMIAMIDMLVRVDLPHANVSQVLRCILSGEVSGTELESLANTHAIPLHCERCVLVLHLNTLDTEMALDILQNICAPDSGDLVVEIDKYTIALIKTIDDQSDYSDMEQMGLAIQNTLYIETSHNIQVGIGDAVSELGELPQSYRQARRAIDVGRVYRSDSNVYVYRNLLLERFLSDVPADMAERYSACLFNRKNPRLLNEEMLMTIEKFFENNLNLSETARQLYIHRNTLVYRLDKVQRVIGLDLRSFDDAVTFKLLLMLGRAADGNTGRTR